MLTSSKSFLSLKRNDMSETVSNFSPHIIYLFFIVHEKAPFFNQKRGYTFYIGSKTSSSSRLYCLVKLKPRPITWAAGITTTKAVSSSSLIFSCKDGNS